MQVVSFKSLYHKCLSQQFEGKTVCPVLYGIADKLFLLYKNLVVKGL